SVDVHDAEDHQNEIIGKITSSLFGQHYQSLIVRLPNGCEIEIHLSGLARTSSSLQNGDDVRLAWPQDSLIVLPSAARPEQVEHTDQKTNEVLKPVAISKL
ncbi:MAG TPA: TOBE domain-containing protein, partial [Blastocatellia bacterium]